MTESTYSDDGHSRGGRYIVNKERCEHRDATTKQRARLRQFECLGNRTHPRPLGPHSVSKSTVTARNSALYRWAKMMIARQTLVAEKAAVRKPSEPDALTNFKSF